MAKKDAEPKTSKADMVRDAIEKLGWGAGPTAFQDYIKQTYNIEMSRAHISQTVSNERKRKGVRGRRRRKGGRGTGAEDSAVTAGAASVADILSFVDMVREWETRIGAAGIRE